MIDDQVAMALMKKMGRDVFHMCAEMAELFAAKIETDNSTADAPTAIRFLAAAFKSAADKP